MPNNCIDCDFCVLVDEDCLCSFSPLPRVPVKDIAPAVLAANAEVDKITSPCIICSDQDDYAELLGSTEFKQYYANLVYRFWVKLYGGGEASRSGLVKKADDDFSNFRVFSSKEVSGAVQEHDSVLSMFEEVFVAKFKALHPDCCEDEDKRDDCPDEFNPVKSPCLSGCRCGKCNTSKEIDFDIGAAF